MATHEAARQDVDPLKNPDASDEQTQDAYDDQSDSHRMKGREIVWPPNAPEFVGLNDR